jgi:hypothetical protein
VRASLQNYRQKEEEEEEEKHVYKIEEKKNDNK